MCDSFVCFRKDKQGAASNDMLTPARQVQAVVSMSALRYVGMLYSQDLRHCISLVPQTERASCHGFEAAGSCIAEMIVNQGS